jgi:hypothetical protein
MSDDNSANKFIKDVAKWDKDMVYKATLIDGRIFKSKGYDNAEMEFNKRQSSHAVRQAKKS